MGLAVEDFEVGRSYRTPGRTVGEGDITTFAGLVGDFTPIHMDEPFAKAQGWPGRIAHGPLAMSMAIGLFTQTGVLGEGVIGLLQLDWKFRGAVSIGDTIGATVTIASTRLTSKPGRGIVAFDFALTNQDDQPVQDGTMTVMMKARDNA